MGDAILTPLQNARELLRAAEASGVRGANLRAIRDALSVLESPQGSGEALTDLHYRRLKPGQRLFDPSRRGLIAHCGARGTVWIYRTRLPGQKRQHEVRFGRYPDMPLAEARAVWVDLCEQRRLGRVPSIENADRTALSIADLVALYLTDYAAKAKRPRSIVEDRRMLERHLVPNFGKMRAVDYGHAEATATLRPLKDRGAFREAQKLRAVISTMWNVATVGSGKVDLGDERWLPPTTPNPMASVAAPGTSVPTYTPTPVELRACWRALSDRAGETAPDALRLQALTGCRIEEVCGLHARELDLDGRIWTLPAARAKNGQAHRILLSPEAVDLINKRMGGKDGWVFPMTTDPERHMAQAAAHRILAGLRSSLPLSNRFRSHSLRSALLTWVAEQGGGRDLRDRMSNHVDRTSVDGRYTRAELDTPARSMWERWARHLEPPQCAGNVTEMWRA